MSDGKQHDADERPVSSAGNGSVLPDDLHDLFGNAHLAADEEDPLAQLRHDPNYAALIRDLEYIAVQARMLFEPAEQTPSDKVWDKIQSQLGTKPPES